MLYISGFSSFFTLMSFVHFLSHRTHIMIIFLVVMKIFFMKGFVFLLIIFVLFFVKSIVLHISCQLFFFKVIVVLFTCITSVCCDIFSFFKYCFSVCFFEVF